MAKRPFAPRLSYLGSLLVAVAFSAGLWSGQPRADEALTSSHGLSAFGELKYGSDFTHLDYVNPDAPKGGQIRVRPTIATRTFDSFNPYVVRGDAADGSQYLYDSLMARAYDEPDALYGLVAESVALPADRSFAVFTLRPEAVFADGSTVTADDVAFSIESLRDKGVPNLAIALKSVTGVTAIDARTLRVDFAKGALTRDLPALVAELPIFSRAFHETHPFEKPTVDAPPLGSGPYRVGPLAQGRSVTYERREDYWARDLPIRRGQFNFDRITFEYFSDADIALEALKTGEYDLNEEFSSYNWAKKYDFEALEKGWMIKTELKDGRPAGTQGYWLNTRRAQFADPRTREAIGMAFDFEWSNKKLFFGLYKRTDSFFENTDLQAEGMPSDAELALLEPFRDQLPEAVFGEPVAPPVSDGSGADRRLLRRATRLLKQAGWALKDGVLVNEAGEKLSIEFLAVAGGGFDRITRPFMQNLKQLGVDARIRTVDAAQYQQVTEAFDFDVAVARFSLTPTPGPQLRGWLSSESRDAVGAQNYPGIASPVIDALIDRIETATSREELKTAASALDRIFRAGFYWVPNWNKGSHTIAYWDRFGKPQDLGIEKPVYDRGVILTWWFDPERSAALDAARAQ